MASSAPFVSFVFTVPFLPARSGFMSRQQPRPRRAQPHGEAHAQGSDPSVHGGTRPVIQVLFGVAPSAFGFAGVLTAAAVVFFAYSGFEAVANLSEETRNSRRTTGLAGLIGVGIVFLLFEVFTIAVNVILSSRQIESNDANVLAVLGDEIWPGWGGKLLIVSVMLSTIATLERTLIQVTRSLFAMGRDRTMPAALGRVHRTWNTPWVAITVVGGVALAMFIASNALGSVGEILSDLADYL